MAPASKVIRDIAYGYLRLEQRFLRLVDTPQFQRLKRIRQVTCQDVFPSTNHTRFEHSLGVLALGRRALSAIGQNAPRRDWGRVRGLQPTVEAALLLHDVGHAPFSHLCEQYYCVPSILRRLREDHHVELALTEDQDCAPHEAMSALVAAACFREDLAAEGVDLELLCRMITGQTYREPEAWPKNVAIQLLKSPCDVDKLDYVVRDNLMTGGQLAAFDHERIASSYTVNEGALVLSQAALSAVTNMVHGRDHMYAWVYNHHTAVYANHLVATFLDHLLATGKVSRDALFSFEAITENLIDDSDILVAMKANRDADDRCRSLFEQLFCRRHHDALWKTWFEFEHVVKRATVRDRILAQAHDPEYLAQTLREQLGAISEDDLYVVKAGFEPFTPVASRNIYLATRRGNRRFTDFFEPRITRDLPPEMLYVFVNRGKVDPRAVLRALSAL